MRNAYHFKNNAVNKKMIIFSAMGFSSKKTGRLKFHQ